MIVELAWARAHASSQVFQLIVVLHAGDTQDTGTSGHAGDIHGKGVAGQEGVL